MSESNDATLFRVRLSESLDKSSITSIDKMGKEITDYEKLVIQGLIRETLYAAEVGICNSLKEELKKPVSIHEKELIEVFFSKLGQWRMKQGQWGKINLVDILFEFVLKIEEHIYPDKWRGWTDGEKIKFPKQMIIDTFKHSTVNMKGEKIEIATNIDATLSPTTMADIHNAMKSLGINRKDYEQILTNKIAKGEFTAKNKLEDIISTLLKEFNKSTSQN